MSSAKSLKIQMFQTEAQHLSTRPKLSISEIHFGSGKLSYVTVYPIYTAYSKHINQTMKTKFLQLVQEEVFRAETLPQWWPYFVGTAQAYTENIATVLKENATSA